MTDDDLTRADLTRELHHERPAVERIYFYCRRAGRWQRGACVCARCRRKGYFPRRRLLDRLRYGRHFAR